jgi:ComF family protein
MLGESLLRFLLPPRCLKCGEDTSEPHALCATCWKNCTFLSPPWCALCGWPFPYKTPWNSLDRSSEQCLACSRHPPLFIQGRSALAYDEGCRPFILKFKHGDGTSLAPGLAKLMLPAGLDILSHTDYLVPVPLHWRRLFWRQYNQATLLAIHLTHETGIPTRPDFLKRHRAATQRGSLKDRQANVKNAFHVPPAKSSLIQGHRLTLIDDVFTTGSTLAECTLPLLKAGAKEVRILTLARVIRSL